MIAKIGCMRLYLTRMLLADVLGMVLGVAALPQTTWADAADAQVKLDVPPPIFEVRYFKKVIQRLQQASVSAIQSLLSALRRLGIV